ncbi:bifunctional 3,4-dihydroxy-2-butanone-4-phosphate synthase/GTP cyclohydrolase II [Kribbella sp. NPDC004536]|uniref:bifunctional 3,4-dihydroxy-2-butanone-4-phosphate synthase/GTP cyclohydrolase II n=1 Tax=Kribbella sp. NPDC004536 TaxID=3364106 RepID=UPI00367EA482
MTRSDSATTDRHRLDSIDDALTDISAGRPVIVVDDEDRENEGDLTVAAELATPETLALLIRYSSGLICAPMVGDDLDRLQLPPMTVVNEDPKCTAFTVSVDARSGVSTGISAPDRCHTVRVLADPDTQATGLSRPGHVFPLRAVNGGVFVRGGHTEAAVDLMKLAGLRPVGVIGEVTKDDGRMARLPDLLQFGRRHRLKLVSIDDLRAYRRRNERLVRRTTEAKLPTRRGPFRVVGYQDLISGVEHLALVAGDIGDGRDVLVRIHSECLTGDALTSIRCDCGSQLDASLDAISRIGRGVVVYLRGHEGRGIGLLEKIRAYGLQDDGLDTVDANLHLGHPPDARRYEAAAHVLADLGITGVQLISNNPAKSEALRDCGIHVAEAIRLPAHVTPFNTDYLVTKRDRLGHEIVGLPENTAIDRLQQSNGVALSTAADVAHPIRTKS